MQVPLKNRLSDPREYVGRRILCYLQGYTINSIFEALIAEVSPSEKWLKLTRSRGESYWVRLEDLILVEVLAEIND